MRDQPCTRRFVTFAAGTASVPAAHVSGAATPLVCGARVLIDRAVSQIEYGIREIAADPGYAADFGMASEVASMALRCHVWPNAESVSAGIAFLCTP